MKTHFFNYLTNFKSRQNTNCHKSEEAQQLTMAISKLKKCPIFEIFHRHKLPYVERFTGFSFQELTAFLKSNMSMIILYHIFNFESLDIQMQTYCALVLMYSLILGHWTLAEIAMKLFSIVSVQTLLYLDHFIFQFSLLFPFTIQVDLSTILHHGCRIP